MTVIPGPSTVIEENVFPLLVNVPVPSKTKTPLCVKVMPAESVTLPDTVILALPVKVPENPVQLIDFAPALPIAMEQVPVDAESKNTSSADVGTLAPPAPPEVVAHLVPASLFQLAVPPTQYLFAIVKPSIRSR